MGYSGNSSSSRLEYGVKEEKWRKRQAKVSHITKGLRFLAKKIGMTMSDLVGEAFSDSPQQMAHGGGFTVV